MKPWHAFLYSMAKDGKIRYVIRHSFESSSNQSMYLQGYGVQVFIKNTEYLVQDPLAYPCAKKGQAYSSVVDLDISTISDRRCLLQGDCFLSGIDWPTLVHYYSLSEEDIQLLRRDWYNWQKSRLFKVNE